MPGKSSEPTIKVTVTIPADLVKALDKHAAQERRTRSGAVRVLLEDALRRRATSAA